MAATTILLDPLLDDDTAAKMVKLCEQFGTYGLYVAETSAGTFAAGLSQRHDAAANYVRTGGRFKRTEALRTLAQRTNYFRESYAYGETISAPGIESFLYHERLIGAAQQLFDRPVIEPAIAYANILLPGQELAVHTDVPEFRGANRKLFPQWLMVVMHHSQLFAAWRMPIATGIAYFGADGAVAPGGALAYYPDGPDAAPRVLDARHNTAIVLDTDSVFHGVDQVGEGEIEPPRIGRGAVVRFKSAGRWSLSSDAPDDETVNYRWNEIRFSVSWKAYCFTDAAEQEAWATHADDLRFDFIIDRLREDLDHRGVLSSAATISETELAALLIDTYERFPTGAVTNG